MDLGWIKDAADEMLRGNFYSNCEVVLTIDGFDIVATRLHHKAERQVTWAELRRDSDILAKAIRETVRQVLPDFMK